MTTVISVGALVVAGTSPQAGASAVHPLPSWSPFDLPNPESVAVTDVVGDPAAGPSQTVTAAAAVAAKQRRTSSPLTTARWPLPVERTVALGQFAERQAARSRASSRIAAADSSPIQPSGAVAVPGTPLAIGAQGVLTHGRFSSARVRQTWANKRSSVAVSVLGRSAAARLGVKGVAFVLRPSGSTASPAAKRLSVALDYRSFAEAYGGGYSSRLRLVQLPACAATTPNVAGCRHEISVGTSSNDLAKQTLAADVTLPDAPAPASSISRSGQAASRTGRTVRAQPNAIVMAAVAGPSSGGGDYRATSLAATGSWSVGNTGAFAYGYPITMPPALAGSTPSVTLSYDSSSVDGRTSTTNDQASWVGDGWDYNPGFVERQYKSCSDDGVTGSVDECWVNDNATIAYNGHSSRLIPTGAGTWRLRDDDGSTVDEVSVAAGSAYYNGMNAGTYWHLTTNDGRQYFFGADHLPASVGGSGTDTSTNAAWGVPVYGNDSGEPCHAATFDASSCTQGWRWNLDFVVDPHHNISVYHYSTETNYYAAGTSHTLTRYVRGGAPTSLTYGQQATDYVAKTSPAAQILFATVQRCDGLNGFSCATAISSTNASHWPDVPWDQNCNSTGTCTNYSPTFWSRLALSKITTQVWNSTLTTPAWSTVDTYALSAPRFPDPGDAGQTGGKATPALWLDSITRTGNDTLGGGAAVTNSPMTFGSAAALPNRVDGNQIQGVPPINRFRLTGITSETGAYTAITYNTTQGCTRTSPPSEDDNHSRCMPERWIPSGYTDPVLDWFNTYPVTQVSDGDNGTVWGGNASPSHVTNYTFSNPSWHRDDSEFTPTKYRTWGDFRGYDTVATATGASPDPITKTVTNYLQGMDGDYLKDGTTQKSASVTTYAGDGIVDADVWAGKPYQTAVYGGSPQTPQTETITTPWRSAPTATLARASLPDISARMTGTQRTDVRQKLADGSWRTARTDYTHDATTGLVTAADDLGQIDSTGNPIAGTTTPRSCTSTSYASDASRNMLNFPDLTITNAGACATSVDATTLSATRVFFDGSTTLGQLSGPGAATSSATLKNAGSGTWTTAATNSYDVYGRVVSTTDALGRTTATNYGTGIAAKYLPASVTTTNSGTAGTTTYSWSSTSKRDLARQLPLTNTDPNGHVTDCVWDGLGRLTKVWLPNHTKASYATSPSMQYGYVVANNKFVSVTSSTLTDANTQNVGVQIFDALLQPRQIQATPRTGENATRLISNIGYDTHGWEVVNDAEFYNNQAAPTGTAVVVVPGQIPDETATSYDDRGRATGQKLYANGALQWSSTTAYVGADKVDTTPPRGGIPTRSTVDIRGQQTALEQSPGAGNDAVTYYGYDAAGRQVRVTGPLAPSADPATSPLTWTTAYNAHGDVTGTTDPDAGTTNNTYDDASDLVQSVSTGNEANATTTTLSYDYSTDPFDRLTSVSAGVGASKKTLRSFTYDPGGQTATNKGFPATSTQYAADGTTPTFVESVGSYNVSGQPASDTQTVKANAAYGNAADLTYKETYAYTPVQGNPDTITISDSSGKTGTTSALIPDESYGYAYNGYGLPVATGGIDTYESNTNYDPHGRVIRATMGTMPNQAVATNSWDEPTGRLRNTTISKESGTSAVDNIDYTYDASGQITSTNDVEGGTGTAVTDTQCYSYDSLQRLTDAWTDNGGTTGNQAVGALGHCNSATAASTHIAGAPASYWQHYDYNLVGDRTATTDNRVSGTTTTATTTNENYTLTTSPHAIASATTAGSTTNYAYDGGRLTSATATASRPAEALTWTPTGRLASTSAGTAATTYGYDTSDQQIAQATTQGGTTKTTLTLGNDVITIVNGVATEVDRTYAFPGGLNAVRVSTAGKTAVHYQGVDQHGTPITDITADAAQQVSRHSYTPFGNPRSSGTTGTTWAGTRTFLNATTESTTGLTTLGARPYNASLGAFVTVDPLLNTSDPQSLNGYAYANNNPINLSDPSGLCIAVPDGGCRSGGVTYGGDQCRTGGENCGGGNQNICGCHHSGTGGGGSSSNPSGGSDDNSSGGSAVSGGGYNRPDPDQCESGNWNCQHVARDAQVVYDIAVHHNQQVLAQRISNGAAEQIYNFNHEVDGKGVPGQDGSPIFDVFLTAVGCDSWAECGLTLGSLGVGKAATAAYDAYKAVRAVRAARDVAHAADAGADGAATAGRDAARSCLNSFTGDTPVTMADGSTEPIKDVKVGDRVLATDPQTGETTAEPVEQLIRHAGKHAMVLVTLADGSVLDSTDRHPIWDATTGRFTYASKLHIGDDIETTGGGLLRITGMTGHIANLTAYNLEISTIHTYYAGSTPVLVHNSCASAAEALNDPSALGGLTPSQVDDLARSAGYDVQPGKVGAANPATRYYVPGTNGSVGFRVLPRGVVGQSGIKGGPYLRYFGGSNAGQRVTLSP